MGNYKSKAMKNLHLILSAAVLLPVALAYGLVPAKVMPLLFDFKEISTDLHNIFRAVMGLYLAVAIVLCIGIFIPKYWQAATIINIVLMGGLSVGRIISLIADGIPSVALLVGLTGEMALAAMAYYNFKKYPG
jgi:hypothetical protein